MYISCESDPCLLQALNVSILVVCDLSVHGGSNTHPMPVFHAENFSRGGGTGAKVNLEIFVGACMLACHSGGLGACFPREF